MLFNARRGARRQQQQQQRKILLGPNPYYVRARTAGEVMSSPLVMRGSDFDPAAGGGSGGRFVPLPLSERMHVTGGRSSVSPPPPLRLVA